MKYEVSYCGFCMDHTCHFGEDVPRYCIRHEKEKHDQLLGKVDNAIRRVIDEQFTDEDCRILIKHLERYIEYKAAKYIHECRTLMDLGVENN